MQIYFIFSRCFGWFHPNELTRISCELPLATILHQRKYCEYAVYNYKLFPSFSCLVNWAMMKPRRVE